MAPAERNKICVPSMRLDLYLKVKDILKNAQENFELSRVLSQLKLIQDEIAHQIACSCIFNVLDNIKLRLAVMIKLSGSCSALATQEWYKPTAIVAGKSLNRSEG